MLNDSADLAFSVAGFSGQSVPFRGITFDKNGTCTSPVRRDEVIAMINEGGYTDTVLISHGWNNDAHDAQTLYHDFIAGVGDLAGQHGQMLPDGIKPIFVGMFWPSAALVWPSEATPDVAADPLGPLVKSVEARRLVEDMDAATAEAFMAMIAGKEVVNDAELDALSALLAPQFAAAESDENAPDGPFTAEDMAYTFRNAKSLAEPGGTSSGGGFDTGGAIGNGGTGANAQTAGGVVAGLFGLRRLLRFATVLQMKDRAGVIGAHGVADTLDRLLAETRSQIHLVGHSFGAKITMTALSRGAVPRPVHSALLLQPAVNLLAFSPDVLGRPGGFRPVLARCEKPVLSTHSKHDFPLRQVFHLAVRRRKDIGEAMAAPGISQFAAMGGYGPRNLGAGEVTSIALPAPSTAYPALDGCEVVDLDGDIGITGHSDVTNGYTFWAMLQNLR